MKNIFALSVLLIFTLSAIAQNKYFTKQGIARFDATTKTSPENIAATNKSVVALLDISNGSLQFSVMMKSFLFEKALMEEHFNENYVESDKYPKSEFKGSILNNSSVNYAKDGSYPANVKGNMTLHGVTKELEASGKVIVKNGLPQLSSEFSIKLSDFNVSIPKLVGDKVASIAKIDIDCKLELFTKK